MTTNVYTYTIELPDGRELEIQVLGDSEAAALMQIEERLTSLGLESVEYAA